MNITSKSNSTSAALAERAAAGIGRASSSAHQAVDRMAESAAFAAERLGRTGGQLRAKQDYWMGAARGCVRNHPLASIGIALGVGLLLSRFTGSHDVD